MMIKFTSQSGRWVVALLVCAAHFLSVGAQSVKTDDWLEDFAQLKGELAGHYANLDWAIHARRLDLKQQSESTDLRLRQAGNEAEAKKAMEAFLDSFGDGHLTIEWPSSIASLKENQAEPSRDLTPICERLRYRRQNVGWRLGYVEMNNFREISTPDSGYFPVGVLQVSPNRNVGLIRIAIFSEYAFPEICEQVTAELGLSKVSPCDDHCKDTVQRRSGDLLTLALVRQIGVLIKAKVDALAIDITGNGGGTNWTEAAARTLTAKPLRSPRQQFIRHEHWTKQLERRLAAIEADLPHSTPAIGRWLEKGQAILREAITQSRRTCVRDGIWENIRPTCSIVVNSPTLYPQSVLPHARPGSLPDRPSSHYLYYPSRYKYVEGIYSGPLIVLVDQGTWSSAEYFAAMLADNDAAILIGAPTGGAGCGYTNGGIPTILRNSRAKVKIPDCIRLRKDDSNEAAGVTPQVLVPWRSNDNRYQRAKRVSDEISRLISENIKK